MFPILFPVVRNCLRRWSLLQAALLICVAGALSAQTSGNARVPREPAACEALSTFKLPGVAKITAEVVSSGTIRTSAGERITGLPPFCRVRLAASFGAHSSDAIEVWLPAAGWNGRFLGTGNGGGAGGVAYGGLGPGLRRGFTVANSDLGTAPNANQAAAFPEKWADFGYRATHEMTVLAKTLIRAYYGRAAEKSYFVGCSTGGQQALSEAQRYPADYSGIIAGAPANNRTHLHSEFLWHYQATHKVEGQSLLPSDLIAQLTQAVVTACAGKDGGAASDNFLTDPRLCAFNPDSLPQCTAGASAGCFTPQQIAALHAIYAGPTNPRTGERIYAPLPFGAEASGLGLKDQEDETWFTQQQMYPFLWAFGGGFDPARFDFDRDEEKLDQRLAGVVNANNPDLRAFRQKGGKLIMFTGTADPIVPYPDAIHYYERVIGFEAKHLPSGAADPLAATQNFFRYYLVPGMGHCGGGPGLSSVGQQIEDEESDNDLLHLLELWAEEGRAPERILAVGSNGGGKAGQGPIRRNVCPYPEIPTYKGGNPAAETSFRCEVHPRGKVLAPASRYLR